MSQVMHLPRKAVPAVKALTEREHQVVGGMARGMSNAEIGRQLFLSEDTVKTHARSIFKKLRARDRAHAVSLAHTLGLFGGDGGPSMVREQISADILSVRQPCHTHRYLVPGCVTCIRYRALTDAARVALEGRDAARELRRDVAP